jgi:hypothetical protein
LSRKKTTRFTVYLHQEDTSTTINGRYGGYSYGSEIFAHHATTTSTL